MDRDRCVVNIGSGAGKRPASAIGLARGCLRLDIPADSEPCLTLGHRCDTSVVRTATTVSIGGGSNGPRTK